VRPALEVADIVRAPNKKEMLYDLLMAKLPYHPQSVRRGTRFDAELRDPLLFGSVGVPKDALALLGSQPAADSVVHARLLAFPKPTLACVGGHAIAGGLVLVLAFPFVFELALVLVFEFVFEFAFAEEAADGPGDAAESTEELLALLLAFPLVLEFVFVLELRFEFAGQTGHGSLLGWFVGVTRPSDPSAPPAGSRTCA